jgi:hypothetical protein
VLADESSPGGSTFDYMDGIGNSRRGCLRPGVELDLQEESTAIHTSPHSRVRVDTSTFRFPFSFFETGHASHEYCRCKTRSPGLRQFYLFVVAPGTH